MLQVIFYLFAGLTVLSAVMVVTQNNPVRCILFLVLAFFGSAVLWLLLRAEFLALILVLVYVGAVMTLFLFVVMMLNIDIESIKTNLIKYLPFGLILVALLVGLLMHAIPVDWFKAVSHDGVTTISNTEALGRVLYTDYAFAFELAAVILLVAIIAAIVLVHRHAVRVKQQNIVKQIMTRREDRVILVDLKSDDSL